MLKASGVRLRLKIRICGRRFERQIRRVTVISDRVRRVGGRSSTGVQEIWGPDNQLYGFIVYQEWTMEVNRVELVDDNTLRLWYKRYYGGGGK